MLKELLAVLAGLGREECAVYQFGIRQRTFHSRRAYKCCSADTKCAPNGFALRRLYHLPGCLHPGRSARPTLGARLAPGTTTGCVPMYAMFPMPGPVPVDTAPPPVLAIDKLILKAAICNNSGQPLKMLSRLVW